MPPAPRRYMRRFTPLVVGGGVLLLQGCFCHHDEIIHADVSPNGRYVAYIRVSDETTPLNSAHYVVSLRRIGAGCERDEEEQVMAVTHGSGMRTNWDGNGHLLVSCAACSLTSGDIYKRVPRWKDVSISYVDVPDSAAP